MTAAVQILTTSSLDSSTCLVLSEPNGSKILVDCGEGCQRAFLECSGSGKLSAVKGVCISHLAPDSIGGLPGGILTLADTQTVMIEAARQTAAARMEGMATTKATNLTKMPTNPTPKQQQPAIQIVGPPGTQAFLHSLRHFMRRDQFGWSVREGRVDRIRAAPAKKQPKRNGAKGSLLLDHETHFSVTSIPFAERLQQSQQRQQQVCGQKRPRHPPERPTLSFVFATDPLPGKFLPQKAQALGVPKGPLYGKLKSGQSVSFTDAVTGETRTVESGEVLMPASPGVAVAMLWYPGGGCSGDGENDDDDDDDDVTNGTDQLSSFFASLDHLGLDTNTGGNVQMELIVHNVPHPDVFRNAAALQWRQQWPNTTRHLVLDRRRPRKGTAIPFRSAVQGALARSRLCPEVYLKPSLPAADVLANGCNTESNIFYPTAGTEYCLLPRSRAGEVPRAPYDVQAMLAEVERLVTETGALALAKKYFDPDDSHAPNGTSRGKLVFSGTGSAVPCKHRNVSGMCLTCNNDNSMLLDIGEGTIGQLLRCQQEYSRHGSLDLIRAVWVSHPHADHHLGILRLLHERSAEEPLLILAPPNLFAFLEECCASGAISSGLYQQVSCYNLLSEDSRDRQCLMQSLGISGCRAVPVSHCQHSFAVILEGTPFGKLVYSGDCRPSSPLARAATGADLLIHEATFEDGMEAEATLKRHSTIGEALRIGTEMQAKCVVLTHFSQRYPKLPPEAADTDFAGPVVFAYDYMQLRPETLALASKLTPAVRLLYAEEAAADPPPTEENDAAAAAAMEVPGLFAQKELL